MSRFREAFPDLNFWRVGDLIVEGDFVVGRWEGGGTHTGLLLTTFASELFRRHPVGRCGLLEPQCFGLKMAKVQKKLVWTMMLLLFSSSAVHAQPESRR
jgi:SnoaL-like polyketide cyclase